MKSRTLPQLIYFLQEELAISPQDLALSLRQSQVSVNSLPMLLWQYGLVNLTQLNQILDWLDET